MVTTYPHPAGWLTERARLFEEMFKVYELDGCESENKLNKFIESLN